MSHLTFHFAQFQECMRWKLQKVFLQPPAKNWHEEQSCHISEKSSPNYIRLVPQNWGPFKFYFILTLEICVTHCCQHLLSGAPRFLQHAWNSEWCHTTKKLKRILFRSISRDCFIQNKITWEPGLWSRSSHSQMMFTQHWFALFFVFLFLLHGCQGTAADGGEGKAEEESRESFLPRKGLSFAGLWERVQDPGLASGFAVGCKAQPAPHSWPAQAHGILAASSSLLLRDVRPNATLVHLALLLGEHRSSSVWCRAWLQPQKSSTFN